ncbi:MAG: EAL domain-containing protein [Kineosporiaceae bacterium]
MIPSSRGRSLVTAVLLIGLATGAGWSTLALKHAGENLIEAQTDLQEAATALRELDGWEWRAISGAYPSTRVRAEIDGSATRMDTLLADAASEGWERGEAEELATRSSAYRAAVEHELDLLSAGDRDGAGEYDEAEVDPRFDAAMDLIKQQTLQLSAQARQRHTYSDIGILLIILGALGLGALVLIRRLRADVRHRAEQRIGSRYRALVDQSTDLVMVTDLTGRLTYLSPSAERFITGDLGLTECHHLAELVHPHDRDAAPATAAAAVAADDTHTGLFAARLGHADTWRHFELLVRDLTDDPCVGGVVVSGRDVTERQALQRELTRQAMHDSLTGLPNRVLLAERFAQALAGAPEGGAGLLLIDLDRFKEINDTLGHPMGDALLTRIGPRLASVLLEGDTVARLGGDEFAVLLPAAGSIDAAMSVAETLRAALTEAFVVDTVELQVEASIGVVVSGVHGDDAATLLQRADVAMYVAKSRGIGVFCYDPDCDDHHPDRLALLGDLRRALDGDELVLHFQPQVSLSTREVCGAEALVRWNHPERGLLAPDAFIPLAEHTGLIGPLTYHVLDLALGQARRWLDAGCPIRISVNLSSRNLLDDALDTRVADLLQHHGVPADLLLLEVTESAIMSEPVRAAEVLNRLHDQGIRISIDDFGAGYTSLAQLNHLPVHELKVDRSFVITMTEDRSNDMIVRSVVDLGHNLGLSTVAEGVETAEALATLTGYGCDVAQGYHLSRPLPIEEFDRWRAAAQIAPAPLPLPPAQRRPVRDPRPAGH